MKTIIISTFSNEAASKSKGLVLKEKLEALISIGEDISVDFAEIERFASPFFNNSFAALAIQYGFALVNRIKLINLSDIGIDTYESSLDNAKLLVERPEFTEKINQIISNSPKKVE